MMIRKSSDTINPDHYAFGCPEGTWSGRLDGKTFGQAANLRLFFTELATSQKYWFTVQVADQKTPANHGFDFLKEGDPGDVFVLITGKTAHGNPELFGVRRLVLDRLKKIPTE